MIDDSDYRPVPPESFYASGWRAFILEGVIPMGLIGLDALFLVLVGVIDIS